MVVGVGFRSSTQPTRLKKPSSKISVRMQKLSQKVSVFPVALRSAKIEAGKLSQGELTMSLVIDYDLVKASGFSENDLFGEIVLMLFQQDKISLGKASELLGLHRMQFQKLISERGICVHYDIEEFQEDLKTLEETE